MKNVIYAYKRKTDEKIVYVGQTVNLKNRHYRHIKIDPWDCTLVEYNY
ncbi:MAG: GIY-YIG nuclease family protein, partial [Peptostreptococcaceae bacterium]|nr:GIY-YIG nuclease family protein [Peptostreptococcaceae bacterium]